MTIHAIRILKLLAPLTSKYSGLTDAAVDLFIAVASRGQAEAHLQVPLIGQDPLNKLQVPYDAVLRALIRGSAPFLGTYCPIFGDKTF